MQKKEYDHLVKEKSPKSKVMLPLIRAFVVGGAICCFGQGLRDIGERCLSLEEEAAGCFTSVCLIFLSALLTGLGLYDRLGKFAGAGSIVPITGFANSVVSPAMEYKREGFVLGVGAKMFTVAGPVLVYGISASVLYGAVYWLVLKIGGMMGC